MFSSVWIVGIYKSAMWCINARLAFVFNVCRVLCSIHKNTCAFIFKYKLIRKLQTRTYLRNSPCFYNIKMHVYHIAMYNDEDMISRIFISAISLKIVAGSWTSWVTSWQIESILTITYWKHFFVNTNIFHKCLQPICCLKNNVVDKEGIRIDVHRYDRSFSEIRSKSPDK